MACDSGGEEVMRPQELAPDVDEEMQMLLVDAPAVHLGAGGGGALVIVLPQRAPNGEEEQVDDAEKPDLATRTAEGSSGETGAGTETVLLLSNIDKVGGSFTKDALLGRLCICNGSAASTTLLLELDQKMPTRLLHLTGPVEQQIHIQRAQGITAYLLQTKEESLPYCMAAGFSVGDDRPLPVGLGIAPVNTRVPVKWPSCMKRKDDLISHLPDPKADKAGDANEGCDTTLLLLVVDDKASSPPESVVVDEALSTQDASSRDPNQRREALLYWIQLLNKFGAEHKADWENLPPLLNAAKVKLGDMNTTEMLLMGDANVNEVDAIGNIYGLYWFLICTSITQDPGTLWILLKNDARIFQGNTHGPIHVAACQNMCFNKNSASMIPCSHQKNQLMKKEGGGWLLDNEFDGLTRCYAGPDASAGLVSIIFSALVARMKSHCDLKQGFTFEIAPANTRIQVKWPLDTSGHDLSYLQDPKAHKIGGTGEVDYRDAMEGCLTLLLLVVVDDKTSPPSVVVEGVSTKRSICISSVDKALSTQDASRHPTERRDALLWIQLFNQFGVEHKLDWRSLPPLHNTAKDRDMDTEEMLLRGDADVNQVNAIGHIALYWLLTGTSSTLDPRTVWLLLKNDAKIFMGNTNGPLHMAAFQNIPSYIYSASMIPWDSSSIQKNQAMDKECGDWLTDEELNDFERRQLILCSDSNNVLGQQSNKHRPNNVYSHKNGDSTKNDSLAIPIFVRHISGELTVTVSLDQPLQYLMRLYAQMTKTKLECQYFVYGRKRLEPDHTLLFYGVERNTTVHVCTRLLGGMTTIEEYLGDNRAKFLTEVTLPDGKISLQMTKQGCLFLSTWLKCFTSAFTKFKSWGGKFSLKDFKVSNGHVLVATNPIHMLISDSMKADMVCLVKHIREIFYKNKPYLISPFPPYLENLTTFLGKLQAPYLSKEDKLIIETHMCCVESTARGILLINLRRKYKSLDATGKSAWDLAMIDAKKKKGFAHCNNLSKVAVFEDVINAVQNQSKAYTTSKNSTFTLMRDEFMHGPSKRFDKSSKRWREKFKNDDGIELMIPAYNKDLIPDILEKWIYSKKVDIEAELLAVQVRCTCHLCHPSHSDSGSKGGGESSKAGKGKQPSQAATSPGFSQPASPASSVSSGRSFLEAFRSAGLHSSSSRFSSPSSQDICNTLISSQ